MIGVPVVVGGDEEAPTKVEAEGLSSVVAVMAVDGHHHLGVSAMHVAKRGIGRSSALIQGTSNRKIIRRTILCMKKRSMSLL